MKDIELKISTEGKDPITLVLNVPKSIEDYIEKGYSTEAIESMLELDLRRKLAVIGREDMRSEDPSDYDTLKSELESFVYVPGRKSGTGRTAEIRKEGKRQAFTMVAQLSPEEIMALNSVQNDNPEKFDEIIALPTVEKMKEVLAEIA